MTTWKHPKRGEDRSLVFKPEGGRAHERLVFDIHDDEVINPTWAAEFAEWEWKAGAEDCETWTKRPRTLADERDHTDESSAWALPASSSSATTGPDRRIERLDPQPTDVNWRVGIPAKRHDTVPADLPQVEDCFMVCPHCGTKVRPGQLHVDGPGGRVWDLSMDAVAARAALKTHHEAFDKGRTELPTPVPVTQPEEGVEAHEDWTNRADFWKPTRDNVSDTQGVERAEAILEGREQVFNIERTDAEPSPLFALVNAPGITNPDESGFTVDTDADKHLWREGIGAPLPKPVERDPYHVPSWSAWCWKAVNQGHYTTDLAEGGTHVGPVTWAEPGYRGVTQWEDVTNVMTWETPWSRAERGFKRKDTRITKMKGAKLNDKEGDPLSLARPGFLQWLDITNPPAGFIGPLFLPQLPATIVLVDVCSECGKQRCKRHLGVVEVERTVKQARCHHCGEAADKPTAKVCARHRSYELAHPKPAPSPWRSPGYRLLPMAERWAWAEDYFDRSTLRGIERANIRETERWNWPGWLQVRGRVLDIKRRGLAGQERHRWISSRGCYVEDGWEHPAPPRPKPATMWDRRRGFRFRLTRPIQPRDMLHVEADGTEWRQKGSSYEEGWCPKLAAKKDRSVPRWKWHQDWSPKKDAKKDRSIPIADAVPVRQRPLHLEEAPESQLTRAMLWLTARLHNVPALKRTELLHEVPAPGTPRPTRRRKGVVHTAQTPKADRRVKWETVNVPYAHEPAALYAPRHDHRRPRNSVAPTIEQSTIKERIRADGRFVPVPELRIGAEAAGIAWATIERAAMAVAIKVRAIGWMALPMERPKPPRHLRSL